MGNIFDCSDQKDNYAFEVNNQMSFHGKKTGEQKKANSRAAILKMCQEILNDNDNMLNRGYNDYFSNDSISPNNKINATFQRPKLNLTDICLDNNADISNLQPSKLKNNGLFSNFDNNTATYYHSSFRPTNDNEIQTCERELSSKSKFIPIQNFNNDDFDMSSSEINSPHRASPQFQQRTNRSNLTQKSKKRDMSLSPETLTTPIRGNSKKKPTFTSTSNEGIPLQRYRYEDDDFSVSKRKPLFSNRKVSPPQKPNPTKPGTRTKKKVGTTHLRCKVSIPFPLRKTFMRREALSIGKEDSDTVELSYNLLDTLDNTCIIYDGNILKLHLTNSSTGEYKIVTRYFQITKNAFRYFNSIYSSEVYNGKPLVQFDIRHIENIQIARKSENFSFGFDIYLDNSKDEFHFGTDDVDFGENIIKVIMLIKSYYEDIQVIKMKNKV